MPLTHVCMWSNQKWKRITAKEASVMFPFGASAHSGLFMCELCGQFVSLTRGTVQARHFRHSSKEQNKDCEDRSDIYGYTAFFEAEAHSLPLRIQIKGRDRFELELGFIQIPAYLFTKAENHSITISYGQSLSKRFVYSFSRLNTDGITYLAIGNEPQSEYRVDVSPEIKWITSFWPKKIEGVLTGGAVFDAYTRKKLPYDADVMVGHEYLIVKKGRPWINSSTIRQSEVCAMIIGWERWYVYKVEATEFSEETAKFFLEYHCRLTDEPITMYPVWPVHITSPYIVFHQEREIYIYFQGNADAKLAPLGYIRKIPNDDPKMLIISSPDNSRQQLLSAGRTRVLNYTYFWQKDLNKDIETSSYIVRDLDGKMLQQGIIESLPSGRTIVVRLNYDGTAVVEENERISIKYDITAEKDFWIDSISFNQKIFVFQGCDLVWEGIFRKKNAIISIAKETDILRRLNRCSSNFITADHSLGVLAMKYDEYPKVKAWIYKAIRKGIISMDAVKLLKAGMSGGLTNDYI